MLCDTSNLNTLAFVHFYSFSRETMPSRSFVLYCFFTFFSLALFRAVLSSSIIPFYLAQKIWRAPTPVFQGHSSKLQGKWKFGCKSCAVWWHVVGVEGYGASRTPFSNFFKHYWQNIVAYHSSVTVPGSSNATVATWLYRGMIDAAILRPTFIAACYRTRNDKRIFCHPLQCRKHDSSDLAWIYSVFARSVRRVPSFALSSSCEVPTEWRPLGHLNDPAGFFSPDSSKVLRFSFSIMRLQYFRQ